MGDGSGKSVYPRTYRTSIFIQIVGFVCGALVAWVGVWVLGINWHMIASAYHERGVIDYSEARIGAALYLPLLFAGIYSMAESRNKIILYADAIEKHGLIYKQRLMLNEIAGRRLIWAGPPQVSHWIALIPKLGGIRPLNLPVHVRMDGVLKAWLEKIPDLDKRAK